MKFDIPDIDTQLFQRNLYTRVRLEHYKDLIFSPLALSEPPRVDTASLIQWMIWAEKQSIERGFIERRKRFESTTGRPYPWMVTHVNYWQHGPVEASFEREFPEVVEYCREFPLNELGELVLIAQHGGLDVHLHTDADGFDGFRFYLANRGAEGLHFHFAWDRDVEFPRVPLDWSPFVDLQHKRYAKFPERNLPFRVNSKRAVHAVDPNTCKLGERIGCLLFPKKGLLKDRLLALLDRSTQQYGNHQIWYEEPERS